MIVAMQCSVYASMFAFVRFLFVLFYFSFFFFFYFSVLPLMANKGIYITDAPDNRILEAIRNEYETCRKSEICP